MRRRGLVVLVASIVLLVLLVGGGLLYVRTRTAREQIRAYVERTLARELGLPVHLGGVSLSLRLGAVQPQQPHAGRADPKSRGGGRVGSRGVQGQPLLGEPRAGDGPGERGRDPAEPRRPGRGRDTPGRARARGSRRRRGGAAPARPRTLDADAHGSGPGASGTAAGGASRHGRARPRGTGPGGHGADGMERPAFGRREALRRGAPPDLRGAPRAGSRGG